MSAIAVEHVTTWTMRRLHYAYETKPRGLAPGHIGRTLCNEQAYSQAAIDHDYARIGEFAAGAIQLHEAYAAYIHAGFTIEQAMQIILTIIAAGASRNGEQE